MNFGMNKPRRRSAYRLLAAAAVIIAFGLLGAAKSRLRTFAAPNSATASPSTAASSVLAADKGKFKITTNGQPAGTEEFDIRPNGDHWLAQSTTELKPEQGPTTRVTAHLSLQSDATPTSYAWSMEGAKKAAADITFQGNVATIILHIENAKPFTQQFTFTTPQVVVLDNNAYHQYEILARLYDRDKKGTQTFSVLVPQEMTPGSVTVDAPTDSSGGGKPEELRVRTQDLEVDLYLDSNRKLMRLVAPASNAEVVRE
jgi:hypothetical protein